MKVLIGLVVGLMACVLLGNGLGFLIDQFTSEESATEALEAQLID